jgi:CubicO group peptidase (beta-lactamase class C family)
MLKLGLYLTSVLLIFALQPAVASQALDTQQRALTSCAQVKKKFPNGIARDKQSRRSAIAAGYQAPAVKPARFAEIATRIRPTLPGVLCASRKLNVDNETISQQPDGSLTALAARVANTGASCFVVRRDGRLVGEWYWQGREQSTQTTGFSTMKALTATLIGVAERKGLLSLDQPAADFISEWKGTASSNVTLRHLLSMTSGREMRPDDPLQLVINPDPTSYAISLGQSYPAGSTWRNSDSAVQTLARVLTRATGQTVDLFARTELFAQVGFRNTTLVSDMSGGANMAFNYLTSCRDLSLLVQLYVDGGVWNGQRLLSEQFVAEALSPSSAFMPGYGFLNRLNTPGTQGFNPNLPVGTFDFLGLCGQIGRGIPSERLVYAVMTTASVNSAGSCDPMGQRVGALRDVLTVQ